MIKNWSTKSAAVILPEWLVLDLMFATKKDKSQSDKLGVLICKFSLLNISLRYKSWVLTVEKIIHLAWSKLWVCDSFSAFSVLSFPEIMALEMLNRH